MEVEVAEGLAGPAIVEIAIHIEPAKRPFYRVDRPVLIAIQLLEMVVGQFRIVGIRNARTKMTPAEDRSAAGFPACRGT